MVGVDAVILVETPEGWSPRVSAILAGDDFYRKIQFLCRGVDDPPRRQFGDWQVQLD